MKKAIVIVLGTFISLKSFAAPKSCDGLFTKAVGQESIFVVDPATNEIKVDGDKIAPFFNSDPHGFELSAKAIQLSLGELQANKILSVASGSAITKLKELGFPFFAHVGESSFVKELTRGVLWKEQSPEKAELLQGVQLVVNQATGAQKREFMQESSEMVTSLSSVETLAQIQGLPWKSLDLSRVEAAVIGNKPLVPSYEKLPLIAKFNGGTGKSEDQILQEYNEAILTDRQNILGKFAQLTAQ